jgi:hypothetical protein
MQVKIAFVTGPDGQIDVNRVGAIEDHPAADAKRLIAAGIAAEPTDQELADWDIERRRRDEGRTAELSDLTKADLLAEVPDGVEVSKGATKDEIVAAIVEAEHAPPAAGDAEMDTTDGASIVTAAPGSMEGDSAGPGENADAGTAAEADSDAGTATRSGRRNR